MTSQDAVKPYTGMWKHLAPRILEMRDAGRTPSEIRDVLLSENVKASPNYWWEPQVGNWVIRLIAARAGKPFDPPMRAVRYTSSKHDLGYATYHAHHAHAWLLKTRDRLTGREIGARLGVHYSTALGWVKNYEKLVARYRRWGCPRSGLHPATDRGLGEQEWTQQAQYREFQHVDGEGQ